MTSADIRTDAVVTEHVATGAVQSIDVLDNNLTGTDVLNNSLTGADVNESSLSGVGGPATDGYQETKDATPSVQGTTYLELNYASATEIIDLEDGALGQIVVLAAFNANPTIADASPNFALAGGTDWTPGAADTITLVETVGGGLWIEVARSDN